MLLASRSRSAIAAHMSTLASANSRTLEGCFGVHAFTRATQEKYVAGSALDNIQKAAVAGTPVEMADADHFARGLMSWALDHDVT